MLPNDLRGKVGFVQSTLIAKYRSAIAMQNKTYQHYYSHKINYHIINGHILVSHVHHLELVSGMVWSQALATELVGIGARYSAGA